MTEVSKLFAAGTIVLVRQPISGRYGILRMWNMLASGTLGVKYDLRAGKELWVITVNRRRTRLRILHVDSFGYELITRINYAGKFKVLFDDVEAPMALTRGQLRRLMLDGTTEGDWQSIELQLKPDLFEDN